MAIITPGWFLKGYNQHALRGWDSSLNKNYANNNLLDNGHSNAGSLDEVYRRMNAYTSNPELVGQDIQSFYDYQQKESPQDFVNGYNSYANRINNFWKKDRTYGEDASQINTIYPLLFKNRSNQNSVLDYNIGFQKNQLGTLGSSTWLRRMDWYPEKFDINNPNHRSRIFEITGKDGKKFKVYKEYDGTIGLLPETPALQSTLKPPTLSKPTISNIGQPNPDVLSLSFVPKQPGGSIVARQQPDVQKRDWSKLRNYLPGLFSLSDFIYTLRNNKKIYDEELKGIKPNLQQDYQLHRQIYGDEGTRQQYYKRANEGTTKAGQAISSDLDRNLAYQMEAKRVGDQLKSEGDLADNQEIKRTSEESLKLQHVNQQLRTQVANANNTEINKANAAKHDLLAQKHAAQGTSVSNFIKGLQANLIRGNQERRAWNQRINELEYQEALGNDPRLAQLQNEYYEASNNWSENPTEENQQNLRNASKNLNQYRLWLQKQYYYNNTPQFTTMLGKKGGKIDNNADLLYKVTRDAVEHFRKISKIASDARIKTQPKPIKFHTKKMQYGGRAPFMVYTPLAVGGGESMATTASDTTSNKPKDSEKDKSLDVIKDLFQNINGKGLPVDVNKAYIQLSNSLRMAKEGFGDGIDSEDLSSLYLNNLRLISNLQFSKEKYDLAETNVTNNKGLNEIAVTPDGRIVVQNSENEIEYVGLEDFLNNRSSYRPFTNSELLHVRAYAIDNNNILDIVNNGVGIEKVADFIRTNTSNIGDKDITQEGYVSKELGQIKQGIAALRQEMESLKNAPNGTYQETVRNKIASDKNIQSAINYLWDVLPENMKTVLRLHSKDPGLTIANWIISKSDSITDYKLSPVTGKASKDNSSQQSQGIKLDAATAFVSGKGSRESMEFNTGTSYAVTVNGIHSEFQKSSGENMGQITMDEALQSTLKGVLDFSNATFGGSKLNPTAYNRILINNGEVIGVDLPVGEDKNTPDFTMLKKLQSLDQILLKRGIQDIPENFQEINKICKELKLPPKYDNQGNLNTYNWNRFAAFQVTTDDSVLKNKSAILEDMISQANSEVREQYESFLQSRTATKDYDLKDGFWIFKDPQALYQGTIFVPVRPGYVGAALSGGQNISMSQATELELIQNGYDTSKVSSYKKLYNQSDLNE